MQWITRERPKIDRIACPWLVARFIDRDAEFLYVPYGDVLRIASETGATPYDIPGVELSHVGELCSFDAFLAKYGLDDPALKQLAVIVRGADTSRLDLTPQSVPTKLSGASTHVDGAAGQTDHLGYGPAAGPVLADGTAGQTQHVSGSRQREVVAILPVSKLDVGPQAGLLHRHFQHAVAVERGAALPFQRPAPVRHLRGCELVRVLEGGEGRQLVDQRRKIKDELPAMGVDDLQPGARQRVHRVKARGFRFAHLLTSSSGCSCGSTRRQSLPHDPAPMPTPA